MTDSYLDVDNYQPSKMKLILAWQQLSTKYGVERRHVLTFSNKLNSRFNLLRYF